MSKLIFKITLLLLSNICLSQNSEMAKKVFALINEARTNPTVFSKKYKSSIEKLNPKYSKFLISQKSIKNAIWDSGLEEMARSTVEAHNLNPTYKGKNKLCGNSSGSGSGSNSKDPLYYVCSIYTNVHDIDFKYFGFYFNDKTTAYSFQWGINCERENIKYEFKGIVDTSSVNFEKLNTGKSVTYLSDVEKRMLAEINFVRAYPKIYAKVISKYLSDESKSPFGLKKDTYDAGIELIKELNELPSMSILEPSNCVYLAAKLHGIDCQKRGFFSHTGSDKSNPWERILKQCTSYKTGNENYTAVNNLNVRVPVIILLLDDGISSRGHRYNMLDKSWKYCACFTYSDTNYSHNWVQNFAN